MMNVSVQSALLLWSLLLMVCAMRVGGTSLLRATSQSDEEEVTESRKFSFSSSSSSTSTTTPPPPMTTIHKKSRIETRFPADDDHTLPTLLQVVDPWSGEYVVALDNPLYDQWYNRVVIDTASTPEPQQTTLLPKLRLDKTELTQVRDPLTISWEEVKSIVESDDVLVLYCKEEPRSIKNHGHPFEESSKEPLAETNAGGWAWQKSDMVEVATIAQARATSSKHTNRSTSTLAATSEDYWFMPHFPVTQYDICQFVLYHPSSTGAVSSSSSASRTLKKEVLGSALTSQNYYLEPIAVSEYLSLLQLKDIPTQLHLALGDNPTIMVAQFTTASQGKPVAMYYEGSKNKDGKKVEGSSHTYMADDMCGAPANLTQAGAFQSPGMLHVVELTDLKPDTEYTYKVGLASGQGIVWSDLYAFTSPPVIGGGGGDSGNQQQPPYSYAVYGDQGCPSSKGWDQGGEWVVGMIERETKIPSNDNSTNGTYPMRAIHHIGDLSYARGAGHIWEEWFTMMAPAASKVPLMIGVGNHEYDHTSGGENGKDPSGVTTSHGFKPRWGDMGDDSSGECGVPTSQRFQMPHSHSSNGVFWYSYDFATTHTTVLSGEHDLSPGSPQHAWLVEDLKSVNRTLTPWLVVELHRPLYNGFMRVSANIVGIGMRREFEFLLRDYQVDLVLSGHYHSYFRSCDGLFKSKCNNHGPTHITVGTAGASLNRLPFRRTHWTRKHIGDEYGYGRVTVMNATALHFEFVKAGPLDDETAGAVLDEVWIVRQHPRAAV